MSICLGLQPSNINAGSRKALAGRATVWALKIHVRASCGTWCWLITMNLGLWKKLWPYFAIISQFGNNWRVETYRSMSENLQRNMWEKRSETFFKCWETFWNLPRVLPNSAISVRKRNVTKKCKPRQPFWNWSGMCIWKFNLAVSFHESTAQNAILCLEPSEFWNFRFQKFITAGDSGEL